MRFVSMIVRNYVPFTDSGITELTISFTSDVQITIGSNGSGKTSFQRQLDVYPPVRSEYRKDGFKSLIIEKDGIYYRLETEFEKSSSPHLFYIGDDPENLNIGRTTQIQNELIVEHLGITPFISDLIMNRYDFPKWGNSDRKKFLMNVNPHQIGFVLPLIKLQQSKIKACKNNLARLQSRKILLEQEFLNENDLAALHQEKAAIDQESSSFQQILTNIEVGMRTLGTIDRNLSIRDIPELRKTLVRSRQALSHLAHVSREDSVRQRDRETLLSQLAVCDQQQQDHHSEIDLLATQLQELEAKYQDLASDGDLLQIDSTINRLEIERDKLMIDKPLFELSIEEVKKKHFELDDMRTRLRIFETRTIPLYPSKKRQHRERMLSRGQYRQSSYLNRIQDLESQLEDLTKRQGLKPRDIPDSPCAKDRCPLYAHFMGDYQHNEAKRQQVEKALEKGRRKIKRLNLYVEAMGQYFQASRMYSDQIQWLISQAQMNPILHNVLRSVDILNVLSTNPNLITNKLEIAYHHIEQWLRLKNVSSDLDAAYTLKQRHISTESHDTIKLVSTITDLKDALHRRREAILEVSKKYQHVTKHLEDIETFQSIKQTVLMVEKTYHAMRQSLADGHEQHLLSVLRDHVEMLRKQHLIRINDIERTLRTQSGLQERYQEEVISQMGVIDKELADLIKIEAALVVIPRDNMIHFINTLFNQANLLLKMIWTIPLEIALLEPDNPLTYDFMVLGDNNSSREMKECSAGQLEILSFVINMALRIILGHVNLPLALDEIGKTFDEKHRHNLAMLLKRLVDDHVISQLFLISHHAVLHEAFPDTETLVLRSENILLPQMYNEHVTIR